MRSFGRNCSLRPQNCDRRGAAGLCPPRRVWFSRADMKTLSKVVLASLFLLAVPQVACKHAPPNVGGKAGGAAAAGPGNGPAPAPLIGHNLVYNGDFAKGARSLPWNGELSKPAQGRTFVDKGELCLEVKNRGANRWDAQLRHQHIKLEKGHTYTIQFKMRSTQKTRAYLKVGQAGPPYREFWKLLFGIDERPQTYSGSFTMDAPDDPGDRDGVPHGRAARPPDAGAVHGLPGRRAHRRSAIRRGAGAGAAADPEHAGQPGRLLPVAGQDRDGQEPERGAVGAAEREGRGRRQGDDDSVRLRRGVGRSRLRSPTSRLTRRRAAATRSGWAKTSATRSTSATTCTRR